MNPLKDCFDMVNKLCKNDDVCLMIVFIFIGIMLCCLFRDRIAGYANIESIGSPLDVKVESKQEVVIPNIKNDQSIGIELKPRKPEPTPSTQKQLEIIAKKPTINRDMIKQKTGLLVQDSVIFKPFDEVWNPGFMPLDMVFKNVQKNVVGSMIAMPGQGSASGSASGSAGGSASGSAGGSASGSASGVVDLVLVYAPWCGHSKNMLGDYERVKSEFNGKTINGKKVNILMYDSDVDKDKVKEYGVKGFPSLFIEIDGNRESFPHRTYDKISEYLNAL